jgi:hypothetical protein
MIISPAIESRAINWLDPAPMPTPPPAPSGLRAEMLALNSRWAWEK